MRNFTVRDCIAIFVLIGMFLTGAAISFFTLWHGICAMTYALFSSNPIVSHAALFGCGWIALIVMFCIWAIVKPND